MISIEQYRACIGCFHPRCSIAVNHANCAVFFAVIFTDCLYRSMVSMITVINRSIDTCLQLLFGVMSLFYSVIPCIIDQTCMFIQSIVDVCVYGTVKYGTPNATKTCER